MLIQANALHIPLRDQSINCCVTSPPYWGLRNYSCNGQLGLESTPEEYVSNIVAVFREVKRVLRDDGTLWLNLGDSYATNGHQKSTDRKGNHLTGGGLRSWGEHRQDVMPTVGISGLKPKDLVGIPWRVAFALQANGWYLRSDIIWAKPNPMPESVTDRPTKSHEYLFLLSKSERYYYNAEAIKEPSSPDSHRRYARGRSNEHKWADGGPGNQTIAKTFEHMRKPGVTPKSAVPGSGIKSNESFHAAVCDLVDSRNKRSVWTIPTQPYPEAHFATFPEALIKPCILAGCPPNGLVLDPFIGSGTTLLVSNQLNCQCIGLDLSLSYLHLATNRIAQKCFSF